MLDPPPQKKEKKPVDVDIPKDDSKSLFTVIYVIFFQAKSFDGGMATTLKELPVTYLIPVVINNHFYGDPSDFKEIVLQSSAPEIIEIR